MARQSHCQLTLICKLPLGLYFLIYIHHKLFNKIIIYSLDLISSLTHSTSSVSKVSSRISFNLSVYKCDGLMCLSKRFNTSCNIVHNAMYLVLSRANSFIYWSSFLVSLIRSISSPNFVSVTAISCHVSPQGFFF